MKRSADRNVVDKRGRTALDYALEHLEESELCSCCKVSSLNALS